MGASKYGVTAFLLMFYYTGYSQIVIFIQSGVPPKFFKGLKGAANQKRLKNTALLDVSDEFGCDAKQTFHFLVVINQLNLYIFFDDQK